MSDTVLDRVLQALDAAANSNKDAYDPPIAVLWPDKSGQWADVIAAVREHRRVLTLGNFDPATRAGPAMWVRTAVAGTIQVEGADSLPIVYLPGTSRDKLRSVAADDATLAPLAALQHRSQWFQHPNGKDWTIASLLMNQERGLGLQVAGDAATAEALASGMSHLMREPLARVSNRIIDSAFVNALLNPDPIRLILRWIDDSAAARAGLSPGEWDAFVGQCRSDFGFNPNKDGEVTAAGLLGAASGPWKQVWLRYRESPTDYPNLPNRLRSAKPMDLFAQASLAWPQDNEAAEDQLRNALLDLPTLTPSGARDEIARFEIDHSRRRDSIWAQLDQAPLALALEHLTHVAALSGTPISGATVDEIATSYATGGWKVDLAALRALGEVSSKKDTDAVGAALDALYRGWLDQGAKALQAAIGPSALATTYTAGTAAAVAAGEVVVFVDGLRLDLAHLLVDVLGDVGVKADLMTSYSALPTVTQSAKPVLVPVDQSLLGPGKELDACRAQSGASAGVQVLRSLMKDAGFQVLDAHDTGDPSGRAWTEAGNLDHKGHDLGTAFAREIDTEIAGLARRLRELLDAGWSVVTVVTDHGWLLLPSGLPKNETLPPAVTVTKKGRCARIKDGASVDVPTVPWHWDHDVRIAVAPGISCFEANQQFEHGGVSPQECVVPRIRVTASVTSASAGRPEITSAKWRGLALTVEYADLPDGAKVDLRRQAGDVASSIAQRANFTGVEGKTMLMVTDDDLEGQSAYIVVIGNDGGVLVQRETIVGRNR